MVYKLLTKKTDSTKSSPPAEPKPKYPLLTKKSNQTKSTEDLALRLYELSKEQKALETEYNTVKNQILFRVNKEGSFALIKTPEGLKKACLQKAETVILTDDMKKAKRRLGEVLFMKVVKLSVSLLRDLGGEAAVNKVKVETKESPSIHFYCVKA